jgi:3',5'-cyclic AMP phosphodiesterase CpdA
MKDAFFFAQVSDPHLTSLEQVDWRNLLNKRLLGYLSWRRRRRLEHRAEVLDALRDDLSRTAPEHIAVTGDLTHIGLPEEFRQARGWLEALGEPHKVTVVPGNHDSYVHSGWDESYRQWREYLVSDDPTAGDAGASAQGTFPSLRIRGPVALIGLSTARPSAPFMATGALGDRQLQRLGELLAGTGRQGLFRVVLLHHPPVPGEEKWRKRLTDAGRLCEVIAGQGAELVLHGHLHRPVQSLIEIPGTHVPVFGIPSASSIGPHPGRVAQYHLYKVTRADGRWLLDVAVRAYRADTGMFDEVSNTTLEISR